MAMVLLLLVPPLVYRFPESIFVIPSDDPKDSFIQTNANAREMVSAVIGCAYYCCFVPFKCQALSDRPLAVWVSPCWN
jgi:hypothetical protein